MKARSNPRPIPLDRGQILVVAKALGQQAQTTITNEGRLHDGGWMLGRYRVPVVDVAGKEHQVGVWLITRPSRGWLDGVTGSFERSLERILIKLPVDENRDFEMFKQNTGSRDWAEITLMPTLLHEFTHARDVYSSEVSSQQRAMHERHDFKAYVNQPIEVRARMQELADMAVRSIPEIKRTYSKPNRPPIPAVQWVLEQMALWMEIEPDLTPASRKKILLGVERALRDAGLETEGKGALPNPSQKNPRLVPIGDRKVLEEAADLLTAKLLTWAKATAHKTGAPGYMMQDEIQLPTAGQKGTRGVQIRITGEPTVTGRNKFVLGGSYVRNNITMEVMADRLRRAFGTEKEDSLARMKLRQEILSLLSHELTHGAEPRLKGKYAKQEGEEGFYKAWANDPAEIRANARMIWEQVRGDLDWHIPFYESEKRTGGTKLSLSEYIAEQSREYRHLGKMIGPEGRKKILQIIERELRDAGVTTQGQGALPNPSRKPAGTSVVKHSAVYHIGKLEKGLKIRTVRERMSFEGQGLSVSMVPNAWVTIAKLGRGHLYSLSRRDGQPGRFVDLTGKKEERQAPLAIKAGYVVGAERWRFYHEDEDGSERFMEFATKAQAEHEMEGWGEGRVEQERGYKATPKLKAEWQKSFTGKIPSALSLSIGVLYALEESTDYDGAWWNEDLDIDALSAPRGVIFRKRLVEWSFKEIDWSQAPDIDENPARHQPGSTAVKNPTKFPKRCGCGRIHDEAGWEALPLARSSAGPEGRITYSWGEEHELRNCPCGSTLVRVLVEGDPDPDDVRLKNPARKQPTVEITSDVEDAVDYYLESFVGWDGGYEPDGTICFKATRARMPLKEILQWDDYHAWGELRKGDLLGDPKEVEANLGFRGKEWGDRAMKWIRGEEPMPPIILISGKDGQGIGDGRGRTNVAVGLDLKEMDVIVLKQASKGMCFDYHDSRVEKRAPRRNPSRRPVDASALDLTEVTEGGVTFKTGQPVKIHYLHNTEKSGYFGSRFQQDIEPAGYYLNHVYFNISSPLAGWEEGDAELRNPLVLRFTTDSLDIGTLYGPGSWKARLYNAFKAKGCALTRKLRKAGYDSIVTVSVVEPSTAHTAEIVLLPENCKARGKR